MLFKCQFNIFEEDKKRGGQTKYPPQYEFNRSAFSTKGLSINAGTKVARGPQFCCWNDGNLAIVDVFFDYGGNSIPFCGEYNSERDLFYQIQPHCLLRMHASKCPVDTHSSEYQARKYGIYYVQGLVGFSALSAMSRLDLKLLCIKRTHGPGRRSIPGLSSLFTVFGCQSLTTYIFSSGLIYQDHNLRYLTDQKTWSVDELENSGIFLLVSSYYSHVHGTPRYVQADLSTCSDIPEEIMGNKRCRGAQTTEEEADDRAPRAMQGESGIGVRTGHGGMICAEKLWHLIK